ncbi:MAG TPA: SGNH/GDSL hydrolase family protein [Planctomycetota bacterium]|nr:SGNH/GDSL hydrolase family protein [Planctomycetota bacterium]
MRPLAVAARLALAGAVFVAADLAAGVLLVPQDANFRTKHPWTHHGLIANTSGRSQWGLGDTYPVHVNSLGMIDREVREVTLASERRRVLLMGDSFTEGIGVPFEMSFAGLLQERLAPEVEVLNGAVMSFSPRLQRLRLEQLFEEVGLRVDEVVLLIDISDIQDQVLYRRFVPRRETSAERARRRAWRWVRQHSFTVSSVDTLLGARRKSARRKRYNADVYPPWLDYFWIDDQDPEPYRDPSFPLVRSDWTGDELFESPWTDLGIALAREDVRAILALCRKHDVELTLAAYPWPRQIRAFERECRQTFLWETFAANNGLDFVDLFKAFLPEPDYDPEEVYARCYIQGDVHFNDLGHRIVADALEPYLH